MKRNITALGTGSADAAEYYQTSFFVSDENDDVHIDIPGRSTTLKSI